MQSLITTLLHRPYVVAFLVAFLILGILNRGWGRTLLFLAVGYPIAFLSEFSSIRNGFPYGLYHYVYANLEGELLLGGVPVWDSISYCFMAYASYEMAAWFWWRRGGVTPPLLAAAFLMTLLDVVVDPLAVRGDRWFLGRIFYYPDGGIYFGVPLSNFAGWFLVAVTILFSYQLLERYLFRAPAPIQTRARQASPLLGPLFYGGILVFNLAITFAIGEWVLGLAGIGGQAAAFLILRRASSLPSARCHRR